MTDARESTSPESAGMGYSGPEGNVVFVEGVYPLDSALAALNQCFLGLRVCEEPTAEWALVGAGHPSPPSVSEHHFTKQTFCNSEGYRLEVGVR